VRKTVAVIALTLSLLAIGSLPATAASKLIAQKVSTKTGGVYLAARLLAGHQYRIDVSAPKASAFSGMGGQNYTYVAQQRLYTTSKPFQLKGTTPKSFTVKQAVKGHVTGWILYMDISMVKSKAVTVRIYDLGTK
jgi:hypothetical protein